MLNDPRKSKITLLKTKVAVLKKARILFLGFSIHFLSILVYNFDHIHYEMRLTLIKFVGRDVDAHNHIIRLEHLKTNYQLKYYIMVQHTKTIFLTF